MTHVINNPITKEERSIVDCTSSNKLLFTVMANSQSHAGEEHNLLKTYIFTEPFGRFPFATDHGHIDDEEIVSTLEKSVDYFSKQDRSRTVEWLSFEIARISMLHGKWSAASQTLIPLWRDLSWRRSRWYILIEEVDRILKECAQQTGDVETLVSVEWELLCRRRQANSYHLHRTAH